MDSVKYFNAELSSLYEVKPPISKAKMTAITKGAIKAVKFYKHAVQSVEKFIQKCRPEYKIPGLYVIDSIVRQSRHQFGADKDVFAPRFAKNINTTFYYIYQCAPEEKSKVIRVLNLWQKNAIFQPEVIHPLFDMADPLHPKYKEQAHLASSRAMGKPEDGRPEGVLNGASNRDSVLDKEDGSQLLMGSLPGMGNSEMSLNTRLQQLQHLLGQESKLEGNPDAGQVRFNKKLLDFDYDEDDDDGGGGGGGMDRSDTPPPTQKSHQPGHQPGQPMDALGNLLSNPNILRHLHNIQQQINQPVPLPNMMGSGSQQSQEMKNEPGSSEMRGIPFPFPMDMTQPPPGFPPMPMGLSLSHLGMQMPMNMGMGMSMHPMQGGHFQPNPPIPLPHNQNEPRPSPPPTPIDNNELGLKRDESGFAVEKEDERKRRSRSRSNSRNRQRRPRRSRSRSRSRNDNRRRRTRSRSRSRTRVQRSRSREKDESNEKIKERERLRDRDKRGLPDVKKEHMSVCSTTLWVGHLSKLVNQEALFNTFGQSGEVVSIDQIPPRGCAFVCMLRRQDAVKALKNLARFKLQGKQITLAWAAGKGVKSKEWKDYWDVEFGAAFIPWNKLSHMKRSDLDALEDGGTIDEDTLPPWLKDPASESQTAGPSGIEHPTMLPGFIPMPDMQGLPMGVPNPHAPPSDGQQPFEGANGLPFGHHPSNAMPPNMPNYGMPPPLGLLGPGGLLPGMPFLPHGIRLPQHQSLLPPHMNPALLQGINLPPHNHGQGSGDMPPPGGPNMNLPPGFPFHPFPPQHHPSMMLPGPPSGSHDENSHRDKMRENSGAGDDMELVEMEEASESRNDNDGMPSNSGPWDDRMPKSGHHDQDSHRDVSQDRSTRGESSARPPLPSLLDRLRNLANNDGPLPPTPSKSPGLKRESPRPLFSEAEREALLGGFGRGGPMSDGESMQPGFGMGGPRMPVSPGLANSLRGAPINGNEMGMHFLRPGVDFICPPMETSLGPMHMEEEMIGRGLLGPVPNMPGNFNGMRPPMPLVNAGPRGMLGPRGQPLGPMVRGPNRFFLPPHGNDFDPEEEMMDWRDREREREEWGEPPRDRGRDFDFGGRGRGRGPPSHWRDREMGPERDYGDNDYQENDYMENPRGRGRGGWGGGGRRDRERGRVDRHRRGGGGDWGDRDRRDRGDRGGGNNGRENREPRRRWNTLSPEKREEPVPVTEERVTDTLKHEPEVAEMSSAVEPSEPQNLESSSDPVYPVENPKEGEESEVPPGTE